MSTPRPNFIDVRSASQASSRPLKSPRLHVAGEAPPELSPLDAFALQSRLLAKQLEESTKKGRRMSRLPPLTTESPLVVQGRSEYFRSMSSDAELENGQPPLHEGMGLGYKTEIEDDPTNRPQSMHPRMSTIPPTPDIEPPLPTPPPPPRSALRGTPVTVDTHEDGNNFFGADVRREQSPPPLDDSASIQGTLLEADCASIRENQLEADSASIRETQLETDSASIRETQLETGPIPADMYSQLSPRQVPTLSASPEKFVQKSSFDSTGGLVPPRSLFPKRSSSIMSSPLESTDEEGVSSLGTSFHSHGPRKLSTSSSLMSPGLHPSYRSPSISSDASGLPRPSFNFSRPLSRAGTPGLDTPARQASSDSHTSFLLQDDTACTPVSMSSEGFPDFRDDGTAAPSYIYSKFSLPRGKILQRTSAILLDNPPQARFSWEQPVHEPSNVQTYPLSGQAPPSPPTRPASSTGSRLREEQSSGPSTERSKLSSEVLRPDQESSLDLSHPSTDDARQSEDVPRGRPLTSPLHDAMQRSIAPSTTTSDSASTIKAARSQHSNAPTMAEMSAEEHVAKAVALHEQGSLNESTYHFRHAARQGHATGMLLYALACRHGWGMRPNQREGVEWLRRAAESASVEIADDEDHVKEGKPVDYMERKARKAQFALSIYELGVSHMNGWGIEQDKALALRCFEIAGSWGDVDALAEAGFCYAQGVGCKKNLKKSAHFYRQAEDKGMSMVGNSWIHKAKYNDDGPNTEKKSRSKSRNRKGLFGKK